MALADRLAEAFAERLHQRVHTEFWGYAPDEALSNEQLIAEQCRDHQPRGSWWARTHRSFSRQTPQDATHFNFGRIGDDQIADWARRMAMEEGAAAGVGFGGVRAARRPEYLQPEAPMST